MVEIMLGLLRASREGDWMLQLNLFRAMIPWVFSYDQIFLSTMHRYNKWPTTTNCSCPFLRRWRVQRKSQTPFGKIPADQAIEETINKNTQTSGGTKGFNLKSAASTRYYLTAEHRSMCLRQLRHMLHQTSSKLTHADLDMSRIERAHSDIELLVGILEHEWINPMSGDQPDLVGISTGNLAPLIIAKYIQIEHDVRQKSYQEFTKTRLDSNRTVVKIAKLGLKTFSAMTKKKHLGKASGTELILQGNRNLFGHMILAAESRKLDL